LARNNKNHRVARWVAVISLWTFVLAIVLGFVAQFLVSAVYSIFLSFSILLAVIFLGILFDLIGTAAAAATIAPLNAKAARKVPGARRAVDLIQHAEQVANFCNDVVGDISGIISGTLAAVIVLRLALPFSFDRLELYAGILLTALVAALTVGGKAWGKSLAIHHPTEVMLLVGRILTRLERPLGWFTTTEKRS
jgi:CBS domain containing-hemolysin-like protein